MNNMIEMEATSKINESFNTNVFTVDDYDIGEFVITGKYTTDYATIGSRLLEWEINFRFEQEAGIIISERNLEEFLRLL